MSKFLYSEIKPALNVWQDERAGWNKPDSQDVRGICVGYNHPASANWSYMIYSELLERADGTECMAVTVRRFGQLEGVIYWRPVRYL